jgi:hypothetical protein
MNMIRNAVLLLVALVVSAAPAQASISARGAAVNGQAPAQGATLVVTVVDSTGAVLPGATVTVSGLDPANKAAAVEPAKANEQGAATIVKLAPGRYSIKAEFAGFETRMLPEVRIRNGNNKQALMLPIEGH